MFDILKISKELEFSVTDSVDLVHIMLSLVPKIKNTEQLIKYWENNCFRADTFEEILEQFDEVKDIKEVGSRIFVLGSGMLVVIGIGSIDDDIFKKESV